MDYSKIIVDEPRPAIRRITLNRPDKRNPLSNELRSELFHALESGDKDPDVRGNDDPRRRPLLFGGL